MAIQQFTRGPAGALPILNETIGQVNHLTDKVGINDSMIRLNLDQVSKRLNQIWRGVITSSTVIEHEVFSGVMFAGDGITKSVEVEVVCQIAEVPNIEIGRHFLAVKKYIGYNISVWLCIGIYKDLGELVSSASSKEEDSDSSSSQEEISDSSRSIGSGSSLSSEESSESSQGSSESSGKSSSSSIENSESSERSSESSESSVSSEGSSSSSSDSSKSSGSSESSAASSISSAESSESSRSEASKSSASSAESSSSSSVEESSSSSSQESSSSSSAESSSSSSEAADIEPSSSSSLSEEHEYCQYCPDEATPSYISISLVVPGICAETLLLTRTSPCRWEDDEGNTFVMQADGVHVTLYVDKPEYGGGCLYGPAFAIGTVCHWDGTYTATNGTTVTWRALW